jgi:hypothetical protein
VEEREKKKFEQLDFMGNLLYIFLFVSHHFYKVKIDHKISRPTYVGQKVREAFELDIFIIN